MIESASKGSKLFHQLTIAILNCLIKYGIKRRLNRVKVKYDARCFTIWVGQVLVIPTCDSERFFDVRQVNLLYNEIEYFLVQFLHYLQ